MICVHLALKACLVLCGRFMRRIWIFIHTLFHSLVIYWLIEKRSEAVSVSVVPCALLAPGAFTTSSVPRWHLRAGEPWQRYRGSVLLTELAFLSPSDSLPGTGWESGSWSRFPLLITSQEPSLPVTGWGFHSASLVWGRKQIKNKIKWFIKKPRGTIMAELWLALFPPVQCSTADLSDFSLAFNRRCTRSASARISITRADCCIYFLLTARFIQFVWIPLDRGALSAPSCVFSW